MGFTKGLLNRLQHAVTSDVKGLELAGMVGWVGGFRTDASTGATVLVQDGTADGMGFNVVPDTLAGSFKIYTSGQVWSDIKNISVSGFVPKNPGSTGDAVVVQVTGYNQAQQYVSISVYNASTQALAPTANLVVGFQIQATLVNAVNPNAKI
jgi:hypothetical protein